MPKLPTILLALSLATMPLQAAMPHGGGLDEEGCHTDRKTGEYHCHREPNGACRSGAGGRGPGRRGYAQGRSREKLIVFGKRRVRRMTSRFAQDGRVSQCGP